MLSSVLETGVNKSPIIQRMNYYDAVNIVLLQNPDVGRAATFWDVSRDIRIVCPTSTTSDRSTSIMILAVFR